MSPLHWLFVRDILFSLTLLQEGCDKTYILSSWQARALTQIIGQHIFSSLRAQMSRCVPSEDLGKVFAMLASLESVLPIVGSNLYTNLYNATSDLEYPWMGSFYFAAAAFTIIGSAF